MTAERLKFQFRMRDLLWAVSLVAVAISLEIAIAPGEERIRRGLDANTFAMLLLVKHPCCGAVFGAGIGCLFQKPGWGALLGAAVMLAGGCLYLLDLATRNLRYL